MTTATRQSRWLAALHTPVDAAALGIFRIVFGLAVAWDAWRYLAYGWVTEYYVRPVVHFTYFYLDWVQPWPGWGMYLHYWGMSLCALCVAAGLCYRVTSVLLCLTMGYVFLLEQSVYMNHHYLMLLVAGMLAVMPAHRAYAVDRWRAPATPTTVGRWTVWLLRFQLCVVYAYGAVAKLNPDWLRGEPMYLSLIHI